MLSLAVYEAYTPEGSRVKMEKVLGMCRTNVDTTTSRNQTDPLGNSLVVSSRELCGMGSKWVHPRNPKKPASLTRGRSKKTRSTRGRGGRGGSRGGRGKTRASKSKLDKPVVPKGEAVDEGKERTPTRIREFSPSLSRERETKRSRRQHRSASRSARQRHRHYSPSRRRDRSQSRRSRSRRRSIQRRRDSGSRSRGKYKSSWRYGRGNDGTKS